MAFAFAALALFAAPSANAGVGASYVEISTQEYLADAERALSTDPEAALLLAASAAEQAGSDALWSSLAQTDRIRADALSRLGRNDEAAAALEQARQRLLGREGKSSVTGDIALTAARIAERKEDLPSAVRDYFAAQDAYRDAGDPRGLAAALTGIANISRDAGALDQALDYYGRADSAAPDPGVNSIASALQQGEILIDQGKFSDAEEILLRGASDAKRVQQPVWEGRLLTRLADLHARQGIYDETDASLSEAERLFIDNQAQEEMRFARGVRGHAAFRQGESKAAAAHFGAMFNGLDLGLTGRRFREHHATAAETYQSLNAYEQAIEHQRAFHRISQDMKELATASNVALTTVEFGSVNQDLRVARLENERLERNITLAEANRRLIMTGGVLAVAVILIGIGAWAFTLTRRHERKLDGANEQLQKTIASLNDEVRRRIETEKSYIEARNEAIRANRAKSAFLATMSHEIRTPMNAIMGFNNLVLKTALDPVQRDYCQTIDSSGNHLLKIINDILDISKMESEALSLEVRPFDLRATAHDALRLLLSKAQEKSLDLFLHIDRDVPKSVLGDEGRIRQILINLVGNALKFTDSGSIAIVIEREKNPASEASIRIKVVDTGIGISADAQSRLFDRFSQADESTTRVYGGTGLGLAICRELAILMKGDIGLESAPGEGSTFWVTLNLPPAQEDGAGAGPQQTLDARRALVLDESAFSRKYYKRILNNLGVECIGAVDAACARDALDAAKAKGDPIDLVFLANSLANLESITEMLRAAPDGSFGKLVLSGVHPGMIPQGRDRDFNARIQQPISEFNFIRGFQSDAPKLKLAPAPAPDLSETEYAPPSDHVGRVLVADDNETNRSLVRGILGPTGVTVDAVTNGVEALEAVQTNRYDVILMDINMPRMSGLEATRRIRELAEPVCSVHVIALSGDAMPEAIDEARAAGVNQYMTKPIDITKLIRAIGAVIEGKAQQGGPIEICPSDDALSEALRKAAG